MEPLTIDPFGVVTISAEFMRILLNMLSSFVGSKEFGVGPDGARAQATVTIEDGIRHIRLIVTFSQQITITIRGIVDGDMLIHGKIAIKRKQIHESIKYLPYTTKYSGGFQNNKFFNGRRTYIDGVATVVCNFENGTLRMSYTYHGEHLTYVKRETEESIQLKPKKQQCYHCNVVDWTHVCSGCWNHFVCGSECNIKSWKKDHSKVCRRKIVAGGCSS